MKGELDNFLFCTGTGIIQVTAFTMVFNSYLLCKIKSWGAINLKMKTRNTVPTLRNEK